MASHTGRDTIHITGKAPVKLRAELCSLRKVEGDQDTQEWERQSDRQQHSIHSSQGRTTPPGAAQILSFAMVT